MSANDPAPLDVDALYARLARRIVALGVHLTGDRDLAEDVLQETFLAAHRGRRGFRGEASPETWLHRIAIHAALRARKRRARTRAVERAAVPGGNGDPRHRGGETAHDRLARLERADRLHAAMDRLTEEQRVVLSLLALRELPAKAIAEILGIPEGTVHSRAHAARRRLREALEGRAGVESAGPGTAATHPEDGEHPPDRIGRGTSPGPSD